MKTVSWWWYLKFMIVCSECFLLKAVYYNGNMVRIVCQDKYTQNHHVHSNVSFSVFCLLKRSLWVVPCLMSYEYTQNKRRVVITLVSRLKLNSTWNNYSPIPPQMERMNKILHYFMTSYTHAVRGNCMIILAVCITHHKSVFETCFIFTVDHNSTCTVVEFLLTQDDREIALPPVLLLLYFWPVCRMKRQESKSPKVLNGI